MAASDVRGRQCDDGCDMMWEEGGIMNGRSGEMGNTWERENLGLVYYFARLQKKSTIFQNYNLTP